MQNYVKRFKQTPDISDSSSIPTLTWDIGPWCIRDAILGMTWKSSYLSHDNPSHPPDCGRFRLRATLPNPPCALCLVLDHVFILARVGVLITISVPVDRRSMRFVSEFLINAIVVELGRFGGTCFVGI